MRKETNLAYLIFFESVTSKQVWEMFVIKLVKKVIVVALLMKT